jgi:hypothetical protein
MMISALPVCTFGIRVAPVVWMNSSSSPQSLASNWATRHRSRSERDLEHTLPFRWLTTTSLIFYDEATWTVQLAGMCDISAPEFSVLRFPQSGCRILFAFGMPANTLVPSPATNPSTKTERLSPHSHAWPTKFSPVSKAELHR